MTALDDAVHALRAGGLAIVPTDTVYGLACAAEQREAAEQLFRLKARDAGKPVAVLGPDVGAVVERLPELRGRAEDAMRAVLPGGVTLVLPNPARRYPWLTGPRPDAIGVRVPAVTGVAHELLERIGLVAATSANLSGGPDPRRLADVPDKIRLHVAAVVDGGSLPGTPSTVIDLTGPAPAVLREGAQPSALVLERLASATPAGD